MPFSPLNRWTIVRSLGLTQQTIKPNLSVTILLRQDGPGTPQYSKYLPRNEAHAILLIYDELLFFCRQISLSLDYQVTLSVIKSRLFICCWRFLISAHWGVISVMYSLC